MKLSSFRFILPQELVSKYPANQREDAKLMVVHRGTGKIEHRIFSDIIEYFDENDTLVINDTKTFCSQLTGIKVQDANTASQHTREADIIEVLLLREINAQEHYWDSLVDPARKIRPWNKLAFGDHELTAEVLRNTTSRGRILKFIFNGTREEFFQNLEKLGELPIFKIFHRKPELLDYQRFNPVYAKNLGAILPAASGLHFSAYLLKILELKGIHITPITLHIAYSTLNPVPVEDISKYKLDFEYFAIPPPTVSIVNSSLDTNKRVCAIGLSSMKALESSVSSYARLKANADWTNKFIFPSYKFHIPNALVTNFHLPESISFIATAAFGGQELIMQAYDIAIKEKYRFFIYGDAMLII